MAIFYRKPDRPLGNWLGNVAPGNVSCIVAKDFPIAVDNSLPSNNRIGPVSALP
jgi:hypothetical protein